MREFASERRYSKRKPNRAASGPFSDSAPVLILALVIGLLGLVRNISLHQLPPGVFNGGPTTAPMTFALLTLVGVTLMVRDRGLRLRRFGKLAALIGAAVAAAHWVLPFVSGFTAVPPERLTEGLPFDLSFRMSPSSAMVLAFFSLSLMFRRSHLLASMTALMGMIVLGGVAFGVTYGYVNLSTNMALESFFALILVAAAIVQRLAARSMFQSVFRSDPVGRAVRLSVGISILMPWVAGLFLASRHFILLEAKAMVAWVMAIMAGGFVCVALYTGRLLRRAAQLQRKLDFVRDQSITDPLTGLLNRRGAEIRCRELPVPGTDQDRVAVMLLDLDHFKSYNDQLGHEYGDLILRRAAAVFAGILGRDAVLARWGGEEFLAVIPDADPEMLRQVHRRIRPALRNVHRLGDIDGGLSTSIGAVLIAASSLPDLFDAAVSRADEALYRAKAEGRDRMVFQHLDFTPSSPLGSAVNQQSAPAEIAQKTAPLDKGAA